MTRNRLAFFIMIASLGMALLSTSFFMQGELSVGADEPGLIWLGLAALGACLAIGLYQPPPLDSLSETSVPETPYRWFHITAAMVGVGLLAICAEISGQAFSIEALSHISIHIQFAMFATGCVAIIFGIGKIPVQRWYLFPSNHRLEILSVVGITVLGLVLRLHSLGIIRAFVDELNFTVGIDNVFFRSDTPLLQPFSSITAFTFIYPYLQSLSVMVFGRNLEAVRLVSAIFGALTIPALYFLAKQLFDRRTALIAAIFLSTVPIHLQFSRIGLNNIADPLFGVLAFAFLLRGMRGGQAWHFAAGGVMLGLTQYFYEVGRLLFPALTAVWLLANFRQLQSLKTKLFIFALCFFIVATPLYYTLIVTERPLFERLERSAGQELINKWRFDSPDEFLPLALNRLKIYVLDYLSNPENFVFYYAGDTPPLYYTMTPWFILGLGMALRRFWGRSESLLLGWIAAVILGAVLVSTVNTSARSLVLIPAVIILAAWGIKQAVEVILERRPHWKNRALILITLMLVISQTNYYFNHHIIRVNDRYNMDLVGMEVVFMVDRIAEHYKTPLNIHIIHTTRLSADDTSGMITFLTQIPVKVQITSLHKVERIYFDTLNPNETHLFFVSSYNPNTIERLRSFVSMSGPFDVVLDYNRDRQFVYYIADLRPRFVSD